MSTRPVRALMVISGVRIVLMPPVMALDLVGDDTRYAFVAAAVLFVGAAITDFFDGYLARRWSLTTKSWVLPRHDRGQGHRQRGSDRPGVGEAGLAVGGRHHSARAA